MKRLLTLLVLLLKQGKLFLVGKEVALKTRIVQKKKAAANA
jgi:hypothetical protein